MTIPFANSFKPSALLKISACASALLASLMFAPLMINSAKATDVGVSSNAESGRFLRIGLGKSMIVHLPAEAKDVVIGNTDIVEALVRSRNVAYLFAKKIGQTNIFFFDANGQQIMNIDFEVALDPTSLQKLIQRTLPGTHIKVDVEGSNYVLTGMAMNPLEAKTAVDLATNMSGGAGGDAKVLNAMQIAGEDQVMLQVKVVEIQRDVLKQFGINFKALLSIGGFAFNLSTVNPFSSSSISDANAAGISGVSGANNFSGIVRAMESDGLLRTLAEPNLTAVSGQAATFLAGGEFAYADCSGIPRTCSTAFKNYGIGLNFTPNVLTNGRINLKIHTEVSEINSAVVSDVGGTPSLLTRKADTTLEMPDGGSMMLAGLIRETTRQSIQGTPGLKQLPILGALFRSRDFINNQTELVVMVTPHIVRSVAQKQLQTPDKNFAPANDKQAIIFGRLNKVYGAAGKMPEGTYQGNVGYIVE